MGRATGSAPVSLNYLGGGEGESFWMARYDDVIAVTLRAAEGISLEIKEKKIERRTDTMTSIKFDVGWFGSVAFGRLMARQIIDELDDSGSFLEDWTF